MGRRLGDLDRQADAGHVGEQVSSGAGEVDVGDLAAGEGGDGAGQVQRQPQAAGEVVGGAKRQHPKGGVAVGQPPGGGGQAAVAAAEDQQVRVQREHLGKGVVQAGRVVDGEGGLDWHAGGGQARRQPWVVPAALARAGVDDQHGPATVVDGGGECRLRAQQGDHDLLDTPG